MNLFRLLSFFDVAMSPPRERYDRYKAVIDEVLARPVFELGELKQACHFERPQFITRLVNELVGQGWIVREASQESTLRWNNSKGEFCASRWLDDKLCGTQIYATPQQDRPRERLLADGPESLSNADLLAILIRSGRPGESAVDAGRRLAGRFDARLHQLPGAGRAELKNISAVVGDAAYCQIMAGIELGRRIAALGRIPAIPKIGGSDDAIRYCHNQFARLIEDARQEEFHIVTLDTKNRPIATHQITVGTLDASLVHPREVFRAAIRDAASSVILVHNHPSGDPTPSREDIAVTRRLESAGELIGIDVLDHIVLGAEHSISIRHWQG